jgi:hypothetical protein
VCWQWSLVNILVYSFPACIPHCPQGHYHTHHILLGQQGEDFRQPCPRTLLLKRPNKVCYILFLQRPNTFRHVAH